ncbi:MAG TPA: DNA primase [Bacillota bacterium]|nr:DNA primase [Bacillota bacterium]
MMNRIPEEIIDQVRNSINIVDLIGQYVSLRKSGRSYMGLCPFHSEKTPSFSVQEDKQIFHCFGCGAGGNIFSFLMKLEGVTFPEAIIALAQRAGIAIPSSEWTQTVESPEQLEKQTILKAYESVSRIYHHLLFQTDYGKAAKEYMLKRQIRQDTAEEFAIGFAPDNWEFLTSLLTKRGYSAALMQKAGLLARREYDHKPFDLFRNRLMFPIADSEGRIVAFGGRILGEGHPKYLNSPEHPQFNKSRILFNLAKAKSHIRKKRQVILFEGYMDVIAAWQSGLHNGVASLGTSLTEAQAQILKRYADQVIICYDADNAGIEAAMKASEVLQRIGCQVRIVRLDDGFDPDEFIKKFGSEKFLNRIQDSLSVTSFKMEILRRNYDLTDEQERMEYISAMLDQISTLANAVERDHFLRVLSEQFNLSLEALKQEQKKIFYQQKKAKNRDNLSRNRNNSINNGRHVPVKTLWPAYHNAERKLLALMMYSPDWAEEIMNKVGGNFNVDEYAALAAHLYQYYAQGNRAELSKFISGLEDESLINIASRIAVEEITEDLSSREVSDYIQQVLNYPIWLEMEQLRQEQKKLEKQGNSLGAAQLGIRILELKKSMKPLSTKP